jgi:Glycosyltransferase sugar-binding region containing DXD motif
MGVGSNGRRTRWVPSPRVVIVSLMVLPAVRQFLIGISGATTSGLLTNSGLALPSHAFPTRRQRPPPALLSELTNRGNHNHQEEQAVCEAKSFVYIHDIVHASNDNKNSRPTKSRIPKIVHQTSKSRCLTKMFARVSEPWRSLEGYDYYLHDDNAMIQLLLSHLDEFPMLHDLVQASCLPHGTLKADVWRYLVLWHYGGIYADIDTQPTPLFNTTDPILKDSDQGWFVVEQFHILSQYVMAVSPRHPLMYYALHHATLKLLAQSDTKRTNAALVTGPHALHRAFQDFCEDAGVHIDPQGVGYKPVKAGVYKGTNGRSITVVGRGEFEGEYITREMISLPLKKKQYAKMNMSSFHEDRLQASGQSCLSALYQYHTRNRTMGVQ